MKILTESVLNKLRRLKLPYVLGILLFVFKFSTVNAQFINFSISSKNLGLIYEKESDFEVTRIIPDAIVLNIGNNRRQILVSARTVSNLNYSFAKIPTDIYQIQLTNSNIAVSSNYQRLFPLDFPDTNILIHGRSNNRNSYYHYDLQVAPISFEQEPGQYFYSIIFTLSEQ